jgi:hypothetical protein
MDRQDRLAAVLEETAMKPPNKPHMAAGTAPAQLQAPLASGLKYTAVFTQNDQRQNVDLYNPFLDDIVLTMEYSQGPDFLALDAPVVKGTWQIVDPRTNLVVVNYSVQSDAIKAPYISWALGIGTAHDNGLRWLDIGIFGFRAMITGSQRIRGDGIDVVDTFDVSDISWFRIRPVFSI